MANQPNNPSSSLQHGFVAAAQDFAFPQPAPVTVPGNQLIKRAARNIVARHAGVRTQPQKPDNHPLYLQLAPQSGFVASIADVVALQVPKSTLVDNAPINHLIKYLRTQRLSVAAVNTPAGRVLRVDVPAWKDVPAIHKKLRYYFPHLVTKVAENTEAFSPARSAILRQCVSVPAPRPGS